VANRAEFKRHVSSLSYTGIRTG